MFVPRLLAGWVQVSLSWRRTQLKKVSKKSYECALGIKVLEILNCVRKCKQWKFELGFTFDLYQCILMNYFRQMCFCSSKTCDQKIFPAVMNSVRNRWFVCDLYLIRFSKYHGISVDENPSWEAHIEEISKTISAGLLVLTRISPTIPFETREKSCTSNF